jgi:hypothetical protein
MAADEYCQASFIFRTGTPEQAIELMGWLKGRNLLPGLTTNIRDMHPGWLAGGDRLHSPIVQSFKIDPSACGSLTEVWGYLANGEVSLLTIVLDYAMQNCPDTPSPQGFQWARWAEVDGFSGGAVLLSRHDKPKRINTSHWLSREIGRLTPRNRQPTAEQLWTIYKTASQPPPPKLREQLAYHHMIYLADVFEGWALDKKFTPEESARTIGMAESMRALAEEVGPDWYPPDPKTLSFLGYIARRGLGE